MLRRVLPAAGGGGQLVQRDGLEDLIDERYKRFTTKAIFSAAKKIKQEAIDVLGEGHPDIPTLQEARSSLTKEDIVTEARNLALKEIENELVSKRPSAKKEEKKEAKRLVKAEARKEVEEEQEVAKQNVAEEKEEMSKMDRDALINRLEMKADQMEEIDEDLLKRLKLEQKVDREIERELRKPKGQILGTQARVMPGYSGRVQVGSMPPEELDEYPDPD
jgi:hypothetical protein